MVGLSREDMKALDDYTTIVKSIAVKDARIATLESELAEARADVQFFKEQFDDQVTSREEIEAERDRLTAELAETARKALSIDGELHEALGREDRLATNNARFREALKEREGWHKCSCPEPCDDYNVFPGGCAGRYAADYRAIAALETVKGA